MHYILALLRIFYPILLVFFDRIAFAISGKNLVNILTP